MSRLFCASYSIRIASRELCDSIGKSRSSWSCLSIQGACGSSSVSLSRRLLSLYRLGHSVDAIPARSAGRSTSGAVVPRKRSGAPCASCGNPVVDPKAAWPESWMGALAPHRRDAGWSAQAACAPYADWGHHSAPSKHAGMSPADASCHRASARGSAVTIFYNISVMLRCASHTTGVSRPSFPQRHFPNSRWAAPGPARLARPLRLRSETAAAPSRTASDLPPMLSLSSCASILARRRSEPMASPQPFRQEIDSLRQWPARS